MTLENLKPSTLINIDGTYFRRDAVVAISKIYCDLDSVSHAFDVSLSNGHELRFSREKHVHADRLRDNLLLALNFTSTTVYDRKYE